MAVGAVAGGAVWNSTFGDAGVAESFVDELSKNLAPGSAAMIVLVREMDAEKLLPRMEEPGHVIQTSLSKELEAQIDAALAAAGGEESSGPA